MKRSDWTITKESTSPDFPVQCTYCKRAIGDQHKEDCVRRRRTIVVRMTADYVVDVPEDWTPEQILFQRNEGSWCASNGLREIVEMLEKHDKDECNNDFIDPCDFVVYDYIGEATQEDENNFDKSVKDIAS